MIIYLSGQGGVFNQSYEKWKRTQKKHGYVFSDKWGGTGNPQICKEKLDMEIYLAGSEGLAKQMNEDNEDNLFKGTNVLQSYYYCN